MQPIVVTKAHVRSATMFAGLDVAVLIWTALGLFGMVDPAPMWLSVLALIPVVLIVCMTFFDPPGLEDDDN
jgi:hypothetical protein